MSKVVHVFKNSKIPVEATEPETLVILEDDIEVDLDHPVRKGLVKICPGAKTVQISLNGHSLIVTRSPFSLN